MSSRELARAWDRVAELEEELRQLRHEVFGEEMHVHRLRVNLGLTDNQARIVMCLYRAEGKTVAAHKLMHARVRSRRNYSASDYSLSLSNVYICKIRAVLGPDAIETHRNAGYAMTPLWIRTIKGILNEE